MRFFALLFRWPRVEQQPCWAITNQERGWIWLRLFGASGRNAGKWAGPALVNGFLDGSGDQSFADSLFPSQLARAANGFGFLTRRLFRRLLIEACPLHFPEHAFALHFLF